MIEFTVAPSLREYAASSASLASLDPAVMAQHGLKPGDLLRIATFRREIPVAGVGRFLVREGTGSGSTVSWEALGEPCRARCARAPQWPDFGLRVYDLSE